MNWKRIRNRLPLYHWRAEAFACRAITLLSALGAIVCAIPMMAQDSLPSPDVAIMEAMRVGACMVIFILGIILHGSIMTYRYPNYPDEGVDIFNENKDLDGGNFPPAVV